MNNPFTRGRAAALAFALGAAILATPAIGATDVTDIGSLDQAALAALPSFQAANKQLNDYGANLQKQYIGRARKASQADQQKLGAEFQGKMAAKQRQLFGPLFAKAQVAIASVASSKNLSVVVDKRIVVVGGQDITGSVQRPADQRRRSGAAGVDAAAVQSRLRRPVGDRPDAQGQNGDRRSS